MASLTPPASGHKPGGPGAPAPKRDYGKFVWGAVASSKMMVDARIIANAAAEFLELLERFQQEYAEDSITREVQSAKPKGRARGAESYTDYLGGSLLFDVRGIAWAVEVGAEMLNATIIEVPSSDGDKEGGDSNG